jgi:hypothetical protein
MTNVTWHLEWKLNEIILISHAMCNGMEREEEEYLRSDSKRGHNNHGSGSVRLISNNLALT